MLKSFFRSREWALWAWGGLVLLCAMIGLETWALVWLNGWYRETWDFLQNPHPLIKDAIFNVATDWSQPLSQIEGASEADIAAAATLGDLAKLQIDRFWLQVGKFSVVVFPLIFLNAFDDFFARHYAFRWRQAITYAYMPYWEKTEHEIEGASQRMQEDPQKFALLVEGLGLGVFRSILTLFAFVVILWNVGEGIINKFAEAEALRAAPFDLPIFGWTATTTGSLALAAVVLAVGGTALSFLVGIKLPGLEYNNQRVEARFRKQLVYAEDDKRFAHFHSLTDLFTGLRFNYFRLYLHYSYFALWSGLFLQFVVIADLILVGAGVVLGIITFGVLQQLFHAFGKVVDSLTYFVKNWTTVTELLSVIKRLREFERNIGYSGAPLEGGEAVQEIR